MDGNSGRVSFLIVNLACDDKLAIRDKGSLGKESLVFLSFGRQNIKVSNLENRKEKVGGRLKLLLFTRFGAGSKQEVLKSLFQSSVLSSWTA